MKAMILAAGLGTRLRPITNDMPKPMIPVAGIPNIERLIIHLRDEGIAQFAVNLHYCPQPLMTWLGDGRRLNVEICYFIEKNILGTGGGIRNMLTHVGNDTCIVVNGDVLFMPPIARIVKRHRESGALASMIIRPTDTQEQGTVALSKSGRVKKLRPVGDTPGNQPYMFTGMHVIEPQMGELLPASGCIVRQTYAAMVKRRDALYGIVDDGDFRDLGTPADYLDVHLKILLGEIRLPGFIPPKGGNLIAQSATLHPGASVENSVVGENASIGANIKIKNSIVMAETVVGANLLGQIAMPSGTLINALKRR
ncbi:MAG: NDP-sugar synthase [Deltaproteobacteria bacterium]|nr:NDP-sugar synthase [Deltaproteobacteria bacterium]